MQDETFPELGVGSVEGCDDQESVCSSNEREIDAFPKAFERELVTPTNLQRTHDEQLSTESCGSSVEQTQLHGSNNITNSTNTKDDKCVASSDAASITNKTDDKIDDGENLLLREMKTLEERRKSLLDHHWAVPSKDR